MLTLCVRMKEKFKVSTLSAVYLRVCVAKTDYTRKSGNCVLRSSKQDVCGT